MITKTDKFIAGALVVSLIILGAAQLVPELNTLLITFSQLSHGAELDKQENIPRPVINFTPLEKLTFLMNEILLCVKII